MLRRPVVFAVVNLARPYVFQSPTFMRPKTRALYKITL